MRFLTILFLLTSLCCCDPYKTAWTTTAMVREAAFQTEAAIAKGLRDKVKTCTQKYQLMIQSHNDCIKACVAAQKPETPELVACKANCRKGHAVELAQYEACLQPNYSANEHWIQYARPAINSALTITVSSIQLAENTKDKKLPWLEYLKPALCILVDVFNQWKAVLPDSVKHYSTLVTGALSGTVCKK